VVSRPFRPQPSRAHRRLELFGSPRRRLLTVGLVAALGVGLSATSSVVAAAAVRQATHGHSGKSESSCSAYKAGKNGVIRTFCTGKATATVTAGGTTTVIKGGSCAKSGNYLTVNVGVVTRTGFKGPKPNYFGLDVPPTATTFSNAILSYAVGGASGYATSNSGTVASNHKSGTFSGTDLEGKTVSGSFTC